MIGSLKQFRNLRRIGYGLHLVGLLLRLSRSLWWVLNSLKVKVVTGKGFVMIMAVEDQLPVELEWVSTWLGLSNEGIPGKQKSGIAKEGGTVSKSGLWDFFEEITKVIETGIAVGFDFKGGEARAAEEIARREKEEAKKYGVANGRR
ncbi:hypothetical protein LWI29_029599 [Acer saccharum]|uniref:Uncharacterized protein n=1 Tax=Acer saccharum TaxID=4024 RepID=A0AA39SLE1_ACESA|nr:hypothetical protein LWI29_029599 [Acer saccharum]